MTSLTQQDIQALQSRLEQRRAELRHDLHDKLLQSGDKTFTELAGRVHDAGDESIASMLIDLTTSEIEREVQEVQDIEAALARIRGGDYGVCMDCGEQIAPARLQAYPIAKRCRDCQSRHEDLRGAKDATPSL